MRSTTVAWHDWRIHTALAALWLASGAGARALAQQPADSEAQGTTPLFDATEPLALTLSAEFGAVAKGRDTTKKLDYPGTLSYVAPSGDTVTLTVKLQTRGHFRLRTCQYPPLKVEFDRDQAAHTIFAHQKSFKLVVQCRSGRSYENYLLEESLIYRTYNLLTDMSFRARLARVTYVDATGRHEPETRYAFFLEDDDRMARRNRTEVFKALGTYQSDADPMQMGLVAVFQYLIGNTDWSVAGLHNIVVIRDSTGILYPVPYDFDWSGVIASPYAFPDSRLGISTVRDRLFRGECPTVEGLAPLLARFNAQKDAIYALYRDQAGLEPKRVKQTLDYYDEFYRTINDPRDTRRELQTTCARG
jgi:hypothetical protein